MTKAMIKPAAIADAPSQASLRIFEHLQRGEKDQAAELARSNLVSAATNQRLAQLSFLALSRVDDQENLSTLIESLLLEPALKPEVATLMAQVLLRRERLEEAVSVCRKGLASAGADKSPRLHLVTAQALLATRGNVDEALEHIEIVRRDLPDDMPTLGVYGKLLMMAGRFDEAVAAVGGLAKRAPGLAAVQVLYARALKGARRYDEAGEAFLKAAKIAPTSVQITRLATSALLQAGREQEANEMYRESIATRGRKLSASFREELKAIYGRLNEVRIPSPRLQWAWEVSTRRLGHLPSTDRADWERRCRWGALTDFAIIDWLECRPERFEDVAALVDDASAEAGLMRAALAEGHGALLASAHIGPMFAGPLALHLAKLPHKWLSSTPRIPTTAFADALISTNELTEAQVARSVIDALKTGNLVTVAVDGAMSPKAPRIQWEGATITYSDFVALLSYRLNVPSLFTAAYWDDGRIRFIMKNMPRPEPGEEVGAFAGRWRDVYLAEVGAQFTRGPESLRLTGGIWRHL